METSNPNKDRNEEKGIDRASSIGRKRTDKRKETKTTTNLKLCQRSQEVLIARKQELKHILVHKIRSSRTHTFKTSQQEQYETVTTC